MIQDENSQLISELCFEMLREQCGSDKLKILDLCAGAGGKALHLADLAQKKTADIFAYDVRKKALKELHRRKKLVEVSNIFFLEDNDLSKAAKSKGFDLILIDAPCSGWGTLRRSPEFANAPVDTGLNTLQSELILRAKSLANENTMIAYVTCSVREEENEGLVRKFVKESSLPSIKALNNQIWKSFFGGNWEDFCQDLESSRAHQVREPSNLGMQWGLSKKLSGDGFYLVFVPAKAIL